jgi:hypothetical protein
LHGFKKGKESYPNTLFEGKLEEIMLETKILKYRLKNIYLEKYT